MKNIFIILAVSISALTGCSSIVSTSDYPVAIHSSPSGASFEIVNRTGLTVHSGITPAIITLDSSAGYFKGETYTLTLNRDGYESKIYTLNSSIDGWYWGNLLLGGVLGMLIIDPATGAMYSLPESVDISLDPQSVAIDQGTLTITSIDALSPEQKNQLVQIK
ncbi:MAG: hypothetical protein V7459_09710 [Oceanicoccus sp.]